MVKCLNNDNCYKEFDTVLVAIGRKANIRGLNLERVGVKINEKTEKVEMIKYFFIFRLLEELIKKLKRHMEKIFMH